MARLAKRTLAAQFVDQLGSYELSDLAAATVQLAADNGYGDQIDSLIQAIEQEIIRRHHTGEIQLTTAHELPQDQLDRIASALAEQAGLSHYSYQHQVDPELIGGFEARVGDQVVRDTIQHKLTKLGVTHG